MEKRLKVLVSAYACNPYRGSEHGVGWGWVTMIAKHHEVWVLTAEFQRKDIEQELTRSPELSRGLHFCFVPAKPWFYHPSKRWERIENSALKPIMNLVDSLWLRAAYKSALELSREVDFDLAHQLTWVGFRFPGHLWRMGLPFVWGPIGGLENTPWRLLPLLGVKGALYYGARNTINSLQKTLSVGPRRAFRRAKAGIIAATAGIQAEIERCYGEPSTVICEIGPPPGVAEIFTSRKEGEALRIVWSGLHLPGKALPLLLRGLQFLSPEVNWQLDVLGQGPCTASWRAFAAKLSIADKCRWHGWLARDEALTVVHKGHLFAITSLKDLTSTVLLEALAQGVPVVALDHCGFSNVIDETCGFKVAVTTADQISRSFAGTIEKVWRDEAGRRKLAQGALQRTRVFSWEHKGESLDRVYSAAMDEQAKGVTKAAGIPCESDWLPSKQ